MDAIAKRPCDPRMTIERCELLYDRVIVLGAARKSNASPNIPISSRLMLDLFVPRSIGRLCLEIAIRRISLLPLAEVYVFVGIQIQWRFVNKTFLTEE